MKSRQGKVILKAVEKSRFVVNNKFKILAVLALGSAYMVVGAISDHYAPCGDSAERYLASSPEVNSRVGTIKSFSLRKRTSVSASSSEAAYLLLTFRVLGERATARIVLKANTATCSCSVDAIGTDG